MCHATVWKINTRNALNSGCPQSVPMPNLKYRGHGKGTPTYIQGKGKKKKG